MPDQQSWPTKEVMIPDLLQTAPAARRVLDRYGLRGCGGPHGPAESLEFFSRAHDVPLEQLLEELREAARCEHVAVCEIAPPEDQLADTIFRPFFRAGIAVVLTLGAGWGATLLLRIAGSASFAAASLQEINAHGHAQIFGWVGLFVMGFAYQAFPRFKHTDLWRPRLAYASLWLMLGGLLCRSLLGPLASWSSVLAVLAVAGSVAEIAAIAIFVRVILATLRSAAKPLEFYDYYIVAALGWFLIQAIYETVYFGATLRAADRQQLLSLVATWQGPLRELQIHAFAMLMIFGVSQRLFHYMYGLPAPHPRKSLALLAALNLGILAEITGWLMMMTQGHAWAALWYAGVLLIAAAAAVLVADWRIFSPPEHSDRSLKFLRTAYVWLFVSLGMLVLLPAYQFAVLPHWAADSQAAKIGFSHAYYGATRHAVTVGFISLMIVGVSAKVVPTLQGVNLRALSPLWAPFVLINSGCALRVTTQTLTDFTPAVFPIAGLSGLLELTGLALWGVHLWRLMGARTTEQVCGASAGSLPLVTLSPLPAGPLPSIEPESIVADVIDRYPESLATFLAAGFTPLRSRLLRNTVARRTSIRQACRMLGVDIEQFMAELHRVQSASSPADSRHR